MFEIVFLGTSASAPSARRGLPAQVVKHDEFRFLVDCGEGTQRQILSSGIGFKRLNRIFITHSHLDHILGIGGLLSTYSRWEAIDDLVIYAGRAALDRIHALLYNVVLRGVKSPMPIHLQTVTPGKIFEVDDFSISAFSVKHRGPDCFGYIFEEKGRRPFLPEKAAEHDIPPGPWRRSLVNGDSISLPDGRTITPDMVLGDLKPGTKLVITGDIGTTEALIDHCQDTDLLVCEATYMDAESEMAQQFGHLTARQAATLAQQANAKQLVLTHISRRYREKDILLEAQNIFPNTSVARDFDVFQIKRD